jgi:hypothetical protein
MAQIKKGPDGPEFSSSSTKTKASTFPENDRSKTAPEKLAVEKSYPKGVVALFKNTAREWIEDKCPQLGAALAYFTVFFLSTVGACASGRIRADLRKQRPSSRKDHLTIAVLDRSERNKGDSRHRG